MDRKITSVRAFAFASLCLAAEGMLVFCSSIQKKCGSYRYLGLIRPSILIAPGENENEMNCGCGMNSRWFTRLVSSLLVYNKFDVAEHT